MKKANVQHLTLPTIHRRRRPLRVWSSVVLIVGFVFLICLVRGVYGWSLFRPGNEAVRLEDVRVLTFNHGHQTNARRANPMLQLACVGGAAQGGAMPMTVVCHNVGKVSQGDVEWDCVGDLPPHLIFGHTDVNCEGFRYPNDEWILDGSCALTYTLEYASGRAGTQQYPTGNSMNYGDAYERHQPTRPHSPFAFTNTMNARTSSWTSSVGVVAFLCVLAVALFGFASTRPARHLPEWAAQFGPGVSPIGGYTEAFPTSPLFGRNNGSGPLGLLSAGALGYFLGRRGRQQKSDWVPEALRNRPAPNMERPAQTRAGGARR